MFYCKLQMTKKSLLPNSHEPRPRNGHWTIWDPLRTPRKLASLCYKLAQSTHDAKMATFGAAEENVDKPTRFMIYKYR